MCGRSLFIMLLQGNICQAVRRVTGWDKGGILLPIDTDTKMGTSVAHILCFKHPGLTSPALEVFHPYASIPALIDLEMTSDIINRVAKKMHGMSGPGGIDATA